MKKYFILFLLSNICQAGISTTVEQNIIKLNYKTLFGSCPSNVAGNLSLILMKEYEKSRSLKSIKDLIIEEKYEDKYFLSSYKIDYSPAQNLLKFQFECPKPLLKVQVYRSNGDDFYTAILVDTGKLVDPTYEVLLRAESKLIQHLPSFALSAGHIENAKHEEMAILINKQDEKFYNELSEIILNKDDELMIIMSVDGHASSVFLGKDYWSEKVGKLQRVMTYMRSKKTIPSIINITNAKKIVVKFPDTI